MSIVVGAGRTQIEVRSLWFLLVYASDFLDDLASPDRQKLLSGESDNDLLEAIGVILARDVERRLRSMLAPGYETRVDALTRVRGRVDHLGTTRRRLMDSGRILCRYSLHTVDLPRYRFMLVTLRLLAATSNHQELSKNYARVAQMIERRGVRPIDPTNAELAREQFGRHDGIDKNLLRMCRLVRQMRLPEHSDGEVDLPLLRNDEEAQHVLRRLFETAVRNFYRWQLEPYGYSVRSRSKRWSNDETNPDHLFLPSLEVDALIRSEHRQIVVECKFGPIFDKPRDFNDASSTSRAKLKSGYVRQIFSYCEVFGRDVIPTEGVIIAAKVAASPGRNLDFKLGKWPVKVREIDLKEMPIVIRESLLEAVA